MARTRRAASSRLDESSSLVGYINNLVDGIIWTYPSHLQTSDMVTELDLSCEREGEAPYRAFIEEYDTNEDVVYVSSVLSNTSFPTSQGWGRGYVVVPQGHPLYGKDAIDLINEEEHTIIVHGGIQRGGYARANTRLRSFFEPLDNYWFFSFDTNLWGDDRTSWSRARVVNETIKMRRQLINMFPNVEEFTLWI